MKKQHRQPYSTPTVKVVTFNIESGFAGSFGSQMGAYGTGSFWTMQSSGSYSNEDLQDGGSALGSGFSGSGSTESYGSNEGWF